MNPGRGVGVVKRHFYGSENDVCSPLANCTRTCLDGETTDISSFWLSQGQLAKASSERVASDLTIQILHMLGVSDPGFGFPNSQLVLLQLLRMEKRSPH